MLLEVVKECADRNTNVEGCSRLEFANPGVLNHRTDEIMATACSGSVYIEINQFGSIVEFGLSADWGCSVR